MVLQVLKSTGSLVAADWDKLDLIEWSASWIPSHPTAADVQRGRLSELDRLRSDVVDSAAKRGRDMHAEPRAAVSKAKRAMLNIKELATLTARAEAQRVLGILPKDVPAAVRRRPRGRSR